MAQAKFARKRIDRGYEKDYRDILGLVAAISCHDEASHPFLIYCERMSRKLVGAHWPKIEAVAVALIAQRSLSARQIRDVINSVPQDVVNSHNRRLREKYETQRAAPAGKVRANQASLDCRTTAACLVLDEMHEPSSSWSDCRSESSQSKKRVHVRHLQNAVVRSAPWTVP